MSTIQRNKEKGIRPAWNYVGTLESRETGTNQLEMMESARNVLEQIRDSQVLQCAVAQNIAAVLREIRGLRRDLKKNLRGR